MHGWEDGIDLPEDSVAHAELVGDVGGGVLESVIPNPDPQDVPKRRYWITPDQR